jgi:serine protease AprX
MAVIPNFPGRQWLLAAISVLLLCTPARAAHKARLSADLDDHLAAGSQSISVIIHGTRAEVNALAARYSLQVKRFLKSGAVLDVTAGQLAALQQDEAVDHLSADIRYRSVGMDITPETIGADQVWAGGESFPALTGAGIGVAVIDSGVDPAHAALKGRVAASVDFTGGNGADLFGHGTHVAAIIAGAMGRLAETGDYRGIAYNARIINVRVLGADGSGLASNVIEGIDWIIENRKAYNIKVINLSLGAPVMQPYRDDPVCEAVERAVAAGLIVVAAGGNNGVTATGKQVLGGVVSPGNDPNVITVGALDTHGTAIRSDDTIAKYSSRGPTRYDLVLKPDLVAPGSRIISAEAAGSYLSATFPERHVAGSGADGYMQLSGTSMATGVVSGAVALLLEGNAKLSARDAKAILQLTSSFMPGAGLVASGAGSLNALAAVIFTEYSPKRSQPLTSIAGEPVTRGGISFADATIAHGSLKPLTREASNHGPWAQTIIWTTFVNDTVIWTTGDTIVWTTADRDTIIWTTGGSDTIIWTTVNTIIWTTGTNADADTIIWTTGGGDTDTIIWTTNVG